MAWRDNLRPASFKGAAFWVDQLETTKGRRVPVRKLLGRDGSRQQDLGRDPDEFAVNAYVFGEDYDALLLELEDALCSKGPGALVLPTRGEMWARVTSGPVTTEDPRQRGGIATVRFGVVVEDRDVGSMRVRVDTAQRLQTAATAVTSAAHADFVETYDTAGLPDRHLSTVRRAIEGVSARLRDVSAGATSALNVVSDVTLALDELDDSISTLLSAPSDLATRLIDLTHTALGIADTTVEGIDRITGLPRLMLEAPFARSESTRVTRQAAAKLQQLGEASEPATTDTAERARASVLATARLTRAAGAARASETYASAPFDSTTTALATLEDLSDELDAIGALEAGDDLVAALADLRAAAVAHLTRVAEGLPNTQRHVQRVETNALVLAHALYGDARLEADIVARNGIAHPLFVRGEFEVVSP